MGMNDDGRGRNGLKKPPVGGAFQFPCGYGIVIDAENSLLFYERGDTKVEDHSPSKVRGNKVQVAGYARTIGPTPEDLEVIDEDKIPFYVNFAIKTARDVINTHIGKSGKSKNTAENEEEG